MMNLYRVTVWCEEGPYVSVGLASSIEQAEAGAIGSAIQLGMTPGELVMAGSDDDGVFGAYAVDPRRILVENLSN